MFNLWNPTPLTKVLKELAENRDFLWNRERKLIAMYNEEGGLGGVNHFLARLRENKLNDIDRGRILEIYFPYQLNRRDFEGAALLGLFGLNTLREAALADAQAERTKDPVEKERLDTEARDKTQVGVPAVIVAAIKGAESINDDDKLELEFCEGVEFKARVTQLLTDLSPHLIATANKIKELRQAGVSR